MGFIFICTKFIFKGQMEPKVNDQRELISMLLILLILLGVCQNMDIS